MIERCRGAAAATPTWSGFGDGFKAGAGAARAAGGLDSRSHSEGDMSTWSDPARYAATLAEILEALDRAIQTDDAALRHCLAHVETLRTGVYCCGRHRYSNEADERLEEIGNVLYEASDLTLRIRGIVATAREVRGRLVRVREAVVEEADIDRAANAKRVAAKHMAANRATLSEADRKARRAEAARVAALMPDEARAEALLAKLQGRAA